MKKMLKFNLGKISIYSLVYALSWFITVILQYLKELFFIDLYFIDIYTDQLGQIIGGLSIYLYQKRAFNKNEKVKYFGLELIHNQAHIKSKDKSIKILILIFFASVFDFFIVVIEQHYSLQMKQKTANLFKLRIGVITTIVSSLLCAHSLNFKFGKHHKFSLIVMSVILVIIIILEIFMKSSNILVKPLIFELFLKILRNVIISFIDCIDKYLYEVNYVNPFKILIIEGILKFIYVIIFTASKNLIKTEHLKKFFAENTSGKICGLIFLLLGILLFAIIVRVTQIYCDVIHSPTIKSLADYIFTPLSNIFSFITKQDFNGSIAYFVICEIVSIIIDFFGFVYNDFIVLFCCGLEHDTKVDISSRAGLTINYPKNLLLNDIQIEENNSENRDTQMSGIL